MHWHPTDKHLVITSSLDGTVRIWNLLGEAAFGNLINKYVLKIKARPGQGRLGATSCSYSHGGARIYAGCVDGSVHVWLTNKRVFTREDAVFSVPEATAAISSIAVSPDSKLLALRLERGPIAVYNIEKLQAIPHCTITGANNKYSQSNAAFSPDGQLLVVGTSPSRDGGEEKSQLVFFSMVGWKGPKTFTIEDAFMKIGVISGASVIAVKWQPTTKQIFCSTSTGVVRVLFDPRFSEKGAMLSASRAPKREKDPSDFVEIGEILTPEALPMFKDRVTDSRQIKYLERKDPIKSKMPEKNVNTGPGKNVNTSFFFTKYVTEGKSTYNFRSEDPREALLKYDEKAKADPLFLGPAYQATQPKPQFAPMTFEEEQEEFRKKQRKE